jgi:PadR family transcriptional regulator PadR
MKALSIDQGLLDSEWQEEGGRERRYYHLSQEGQTLLANLTYEWQQQNHHLEKLLGV